MKNNEKKCPYCGGVIKKTAKKCRHCNQWFTGDSFYHNVGKEGLYSKIAEVALELIKDNNRKYTRAELANELEDYGIVSDSYEIGELVAQARNYYSDNNDYKAAITQSFISNEGINNSGKSVELLTNDYVCRTLANNGNTQALHELVESDLQNVNAKINEAISFVSSIANIGSNANQLNTPEGREQALNALVALADKTKIGSQIIGTDDVKTIKSQSVSLYQQYLETLEKYDDAADCVRAVIVDFVSIRFAIYENYVNHVLSLIDIFGDRIRTVAPELFDYDSIEFVDTKQMKNVIDLQYKNILENCKSVIAEINKSFTNNVSQSLSAINRGGAVSYLMAAAGWWEHNQKKEQELIRLKTDYEVMRNHINSDVKVISTDLIRIGYLYNTLKDVYIPKAEAYFKYAYYILNDDLAVIKDVLFSNSKVKDLAEQRERIIEECRKTEEKISDYEANINRCSTIVEQTKQLIERNRDSYNDALSQKPSNWTDNRDKAEWIMWSEPIVSSFRELTVDHRIATLDLEQYNESVENERTRLAKLHAGLADISRRIGSSACISDSDKMRAADHLKGVVGLLHLGKEILESKIDEKYIKAVKLQPYNANIKLPLSVEERLNSMKTNLDAAGVLVQQMDPSDVSETLNKLIANGQQIIQATATLETVRVEGQMADAEYKKQITKLRKQFEKAVQQTEQKSLLVSRIISGLDGLQDREQIRNALMLLLDKPISDEDWLGFVNGNGYIEL